MAKSSTEKSETSKGEATTRSKTKLSTTVKWFRTVVISIVVLAVLGAAGVAAVALVHGTWQVNPIVSGSMRPGLPLGGVVISERIPLDQVALRDVIEFKNPYIPTDLMVHRIVSLTKSKSGQLVIKTQGDANTIQDPWTLTLGGKYAYEARWSLPLLGYAAVAYQNHRGLVLLGVGVVLLGTAASVIYGPKRRDKDHDDGDDDDDDDDDGDERHGSTGFAMPPPTKASEDVTPASKHASTTTLAVEPQPFGIHADRIDGEDPLVPEEPPVQRHWNDRF
jgi:signal peptidase